MIQEKIIIMAPEFWWVYNPGCTSMFTWGREPPAGPCSFCSPRKRPGSVLPSPGLDCPGVVASFFFRSHFLSHPLAPLTCIPLSLPPKLSSVCLQECHHIPSMPLG